MEIKRYFLYIGMFLLVFFTLGMSVYAEETDGIPGKLIEEVDE